MGELKELALVEDLAKAIAYSGIFGVTNEHQARVFAYSCVQKRLDPLSLAQKYHIIGGKDLSMKSEAMLAGFKGAGGKYQIIDANGVSCQINFTMDGETLPVRISWDDISGESWVKDREGNLKQNYATEFARADMLWARVVSRGVRRMAPEVLVGQYTPEEIADFRDLPALTQEERSEGAPVAEAIPVASVVDSEPTVAVEPTPSPAEQHFANRQTVDALQACATALKMPMEKQYAVLQKYGAATWDKLSAENAQVLLTKMSQMCDSQGISAFVGSVNGAVDAALVEEIRGLIGSVAQSDPDITRKLQAKLAECGIQKINQLTFGEGRALRDALMVKDLTQFFAASLEGWAKKDSGTVEQQS